MKGLLLLVTITLWTAFAEIKDLLEEAEYRQIHKTVVTHEYQKKSDTDSTKFFVVGDFGNVAALADLDHVTDILDSLAQNDAYDFIATVGDNVYDFGIESIDNLTKVNQIMSTFKKPNIKDLPMYVTLGNHDCYSDYQNEIEYSKFDNQWTLENDYYELRVPMKDDPAKFFVILMSNSCLLDWMTVFGDDNGQVNCTQMNVDPASPRVKAHYSWVESKLQQYSNDSSIAWLAVAMHHPILVEPGMKQDFLPLLRKYNVDMAIVGHKHTFEYANIGYNDEIKFPGQAYGSINYTCDADTTKEILNTSTRSVNFKKGDTLHQFLVGGSGQKLDSICPYLEQDGKVYFQNIEDHGIVTMEVNSKRFTVQYYEGLTKLIYEIIIEA